MTNPEEPGCPECGHDPMFEFDRGMHWIIIQREFQWWAHTGACVAVFCACVAYLFGGAP